MPYCPILRNGDAWDCGQGTGLAKRRRGGTVGMARPEGIEPPAYRFEACRSIQLSYGRPWNCRIAEGEEGRSFPQSVFECIRRFHQRQERALEPGRRVF